MITNSLFIRIYPVIENAVHFCRNFYLVIVEGVIDCNIALNRHTDLRVSRFLSFFWLVAVIDIAVICRYWVKMAMLKKKMRMELTVIKMDPVMAMALRG